MILGRNRRLEILRRAREILSVKDNWGTKKLRNLSYPGTPKYCVLGALEQAAYDTGYAEQNSSAFGAYGLGYQLGKEMSLTKYARTKYGMAPWRVNDKRGYEVTLQMLDDYIVEVEEGRAL